VIHGSTKNGPRFSKFKKVIQSQNQEIQQHQTEYALTYIHTKNTYTILTNVHTHTHTHTHTNTHKVHNLIVELTKKERLCRRNTTDF
jgi:hypothetical protein